MEHGNILLATAAAAHRLGLPSMANYLIAGVAIGTVSNELRDQLARTMREGSPN